MSFESAETHTFYQKDNLENALTKVREAIELIEETKLPWWSLWRIRRKLKKAATILSKASNSLVVEELPSQE
jgi:hypothetical protein